LAGQHSYGPIVHERTDYDFAADRIAVWLSVKLPVKGMKSSEKWWQGMMGLP